MHENNSSTYENIDIFPTQKSNDNKNDNFHQNLANNIQSGIQPPLDEITIKTNNQENNICSSVNNMTQ